MCSEIDSENRSDCEHKMGETSKIWQYYPLRKKSQPSKPDSNDKQEAENVISKSGSTLSFNRFSPKKFTDDFLFKTPFLPTQKRKIELNQLPSKRTKIEQSGRHHQTSILDFCPRTTKQSNTVETMCIKPSVSISTPKSISTPASTWDNGKFNNNLKTKLEEFQSKVSNKLRLDLSLLYSSHKLVKNEEEKGPICTSPMSFLKDRLKNIEPATLSVPEKKNCLFEDESQVEELRSTIIKKSDLRFLDKLRDFKKIIEATTDDLANKSPEKPNKFFKEKQLRKLRAQKLIESPPRKSERSNENASPVTQSIRTSVQNDLGLPDKYLQLYKIFCNIERIVTVMYNRMETCKFKKLKQNVQKVMKKDFNLSQLAQILTIYPSAYKVEYDNISKDLETQLVLRPNVLTTKMTPFTTVSRTNQFKDNLLSFAKRAHTDFLLKLDQPIVIDDIELIRWHPNFSFPDIPEAKLPEFSRPLSTISSTNQFNRETNSVGNYLSIKLNLAVKKPKSQLRIADSPKSIKSSVKIKSGVLKGLSQEFVEKVRNKSNRASSKSTEEQKKLIELKKLPEFIRSIQSLFINGHKRTISMDQVMELCWTQWSISTDKCLKLIELTNEQLPDWLLILDSSKGKFIKINSQIPLSKLYERLQRTIKSQC